LSMAEEAWQVSGGDLVGAEKHVLALSGNDGAVFRKAMAHVQTKAAIRDRQKKKNDEDMFNELYDQKINTNRMDPELYTRLSKSDPEKLNQLVDRLNKNRGRQAVVSNPEVFDRADAMMNNMTDEEIVKLDLQKLYQSDLSAKDISLLQDRKNYSRKRIDTQFASGQKWNSSIYNEVTSDFAAQFGFMKETPEYSELKFMVQDRYAQIIKENPKITESEIRRKLIREVNEKTTRVKAVEKSTFLGIPIPFTGSKGSVTAPDALREERSLSEEQVRSIQSARFQEGKRPYTEDELSNFARWNSQNK